MDGNNDACDMMSHDKTLGIQPVPNPVTDDEREVHSGLKFSCRLSSCNTIALYDSTSCDISVSLCCYLLQGKTELAWEDGANTNVSSCLKP